MVSKSVHKKNARKVGSLKEDFLIKQKSIVWYQVR